MPKNGRPALSRGTLAPEHLDVAQSLVKVNITPLGHSSIELDSKAVAGFVEPFDPRARIVLLALLAGYPRTIAAAYASTSETSLRRWCQQDPRLAEAVEQAQALGFARAPESELYRRAFNGEDDRGSMRALELIVKARSADYRDKSQARLDIVHHAQRALSSTDGWRDGPQPGMSES